MVLCMFEFDCVWPYTEKFIVFKEDISKFPMADTVLKALETNKAEERINDGDNLYFFIKNNGKKRWEFRYKKPSTENGHS